MGRKLNMDELGRLSPEEFKLKEKTPVIVILDNIRSHHNVGSVFRTSDAFAIQAVWLCGFTPIPPHREIHKTALGATESVEWKHFETTIDAIEAARQLNYKIIAVEQTENAIPLHKVTTEYSGNLAFVFGNEVGGVEQEAIDKCNAVVEIPQWGTKHSLNISVCTGLVLWEVFRQRLDSH